MQTIIGFTCLIAALIAFALAWHDYCWRLGLSALVLAVVGVFCLAVPARAQDVDAIEPSCAVLVKFTLHSYTGEIVIQDVCLSAPVIYADGLMTIETTDFLMDGIFKSGFEVSP